MKLRVIPILLDSGGGGGSVGNTDGSIATDEEFNEMPDDIGL